MFIKWKLWIHLSNKRKVFTLWKIFKCPNWLWMREAEEKAQQTERFYKYLEMWIDKQKDPLKKVIEMNQLGRDNWLKVMEQDEQQYLRTLATTNHRSPFTYSSQHLYFFNPVTSHSKEKKKKKKRFCDFQFFLWWLLFIQYIIRF